MNVWKRAWVTFVLRFVGSFCFARVGDATVEHAIEIAIGIACVSLTIHRIIMIASVNMD